jgi:hypothetical protein
MPRTRCLVGVLLLLVAAAPALAADSARTRRVVGAGQAAPGGGTFERFSIESLPVLAPVNSRGQVAFFATVLRGRASEGLFLASAARVVRLAIGGDAAPGGGTFSGFGKHPIPALNEAGDVAFAAAVAGGKTVEGIFVATQGRLRAVALSGAPAPGVAAGTLASVDTPALNDQGHVAFLATVRRGRETVEAVYVAAGGKLRKVVAQGDAAPAGGAFAGFGTPVLNNKGVVAFAAVVEGRAVPGGVFVAEGEKIRMLVGAGDETPVGGIFAKFSERVALNDAGAVVFNGLLKSAPVAGAIFSADRSGVRRVVALGDEAPGGGVFSNFGLWPTVNAAGAVGFTAAVDGGPIQIGVFAGPAGAIQRVAAIGDLLPEGGTLASFGLYPLAAMSPRGGVSFSVAPTATGEGAEGIYVAPPPRAP